MTLNDLERQSLFCRQSYACLTKRLRLQSRSFRLDILPGHPRSLDIKLVKFCRFIYNLITCDMILLLFCLCMYVYL